MVPRSSKSRKAAAYIFRGCLVLYTSTVGARAYETRVPRRQPPVNVTECCLRGPAKGWWLLPGIITPVTRNTHAVTIRMPDSRVPYAIPLALHLGWEQTTPGAGRVSDCVEYVFRFCRYTALFAAFTDSTTLAG
jgi:hypothetical protein